MSIAFPLPTDDAQSLTNAYLTYLTAVQIQHLPSPSDDSGNEGADDFEGNRLYQFVYKPLPSKNSRSMLPGDNVVPGNNEGVTEEDAADMAETGQEEGLTQDAEEITHASEEDETDDAEMEDFEEYGEVRIRTLSFRPFRLLKFAYPIIRM